MVMDNTDEERCKEIKKKQMKLLAKAHGYSYMILWAFTVAMFL